MEFEQFNVPTQKKEDWKIDSPWYERFKAVGAFQDFELLTGEKDFREKQKRVFLAGEIENPELDYPELETFNLEKREEMLQTLKKTILDNEPNEVLKQVYTWKINEKLAEIRMLEATKAGDDKKVTRYSKFIYGEPSKEYFEYTIFQIKQIVDKNLSHKDPEKRAAAERLNSKLFDAFLNNQTEINPAQFSMPEPKSFKEEKDFSAEEIREYFEQILQSYKAEGWKVLVDQGGKFSAINVSQDKLTVNIPGDRKVKESKLRALAEHEIGTHVARRESGERSKLKILGLGLDRYLKGEEGIATFKEQAILGAKNFSGLDGHLAISLALGLDNQKRDFRQVFEILKDYFFLSSSQKDTKTAMQSAETSAWNRCVRTFRGTTCKTPGACLTRDIVYREGNIGIWNIVSSNPEEVTRFSVGKYDPANPRHIWILEQLGISDKELEDQE